MLPFVPNESKYDMNIISMPQFSRIQINPFAYGIIQLLFNNFKDFKVFFNINEHLFRSAFDVLHQATADLENALKKDYKR